MNLKMFKQGTILVVSSMLLFPLLPKTIKFDIYTLKYVGISIIKIVLILIVAKIGIKIGKKLIIKFFDKQKESSHVPITDKRADTLKTISVSIFKYTIYFIVLTTILSDTLKISIASIMAVAGVGGIAIGFGAQSLVKDVISGFFVLLEDQYAVGDSITVGTMNGTVFEIGLRTTKLKNFNGDIYIIPNGQITTLTNHSRTNKVAIIDLRVAYSENAEFVIDKLKQMCTQIFNDNKGTIVEEPVVLGITEFVDNFYKIRITATTIPDEQYKIERLIRLTAKNLFDKENIKSFDKYSLNSPINMHQKNQKKEL